LHERFCQKIKGKAYLDRQSNFATIEIRRFVHCGSIVKPQSFNSIGIYTVGI
jgi:hypothetical protein